MYHTICFSICASARIVTNDGLPKRTHLEEHIKAGIYVNFKTGARLPSRPDVHDFLAYSVTLMLSRLD